MRMRLRERIINRKKDNRGFTLVELLTAIGILAVLSATIAYMMISSSNTYGRLSVESQLQSEAQLVANAVTELSIDAYEADDKVPAVAPSLTGYDVTSGNLLTLKSTVDGTEKIYIILRKDSANNELYLVEGVQTGPTTHEWTYSLLGNNVETFSADVSRVASENIVSFSLGYKKGHNQSERAYEGKYQVLMRNREYADTVSGNSPQNIPDYLHLTLTPKRVYLDVIKDEVKTVYKENLTSGSTYTTGVKFDVGVVSNRADEAKALGVTWEMLNADEELFVLTKDKLSSTLSWNKASTKKLSDSPIDAFNIYISQELPGRNGGAPVQAKQKMSQVLLRRVKKITVNAISGVTQWKPEYSDYGGIRNPLAQGYAYFNSSGQVNTMTVNASILASNIAYGGGLTWKLERFDNTTNDWDKNPVNSSLASLGLNESDTLTTNTITFGPAAGVGQLYRVTATSKFDDSVSGSYIFGIVPSPTVEDDDGFYSRGYYTNMSSFFKGYTGEGGGCEPVEKIVYIAVTKVDGAAVDAESKNKVKVIQQDGQWRIFVDYDAFSHGGDEKKNFYDGSVAIHMIYGYYGKDGKLYMNGNAHQGVIYNMSAADHEAAMAKQLGVSVDDIEWVNGGTNGEDYDYVLKAVEVTKIAPVQQVIVIEKGKSRTLGIKTAYYNIISPRKGKYYLGAYMNDLLEDESSSDLSDNLLKTGMGDINSTFSVRMVSTYGDADLFVDKANVEISAKALATQKRYLTDPQTLRLTADDYYTITPNNPSSNSYVTYDVVTANIEGTNVYMPGPHAKYSGLTFPALTDGGDRKEIKGLNSANEEITAEVYMLNNKYYCVYMGRKYTYNDTYDFWDK